MLVTLIVTLCLAHGGECIEVPVIEITMEECTAPDAELKLSQWYTSSPYMEMNYHLAGWQCQIKRTPT
jgi:hypothetical protein